MANTLPTDQTDREPHLLQAELEIQSVRSMSTFMAEIEDIRVTNSLSYLESVIHYCESNGIEVETVGSFIKSIPLLKAKIQDEAEQLNFLPKTAKLPI